MSPRIISLLITKSDKQQDTSRAKKDQKFDSGISNEVDIFTKGSQYWESLIQRGMTQDVLTFSEAEILRAAIKYCNGVYMQLTKYQLKEIVRIQAKLKEHMIE